MNEEDFDGDADCPACEDFVNERDAAIECQMKAEARVAELEAEDRRMAELLATTHAAHIAASARVAKLEEGLVGAAEALAQRGDFDGAKTCLRLAQLDEQPTDSVSPHQADDTGGFRLGQLVHSVAHPGQCFVVTFAGRHAEGPLILSVRHFDDPNFQFFDVQANFSPLPPRPPLIVGGVEAGVAQTGGGRSGASPATPASAAQAEVEQRSSKPEVPGTNPGSRFDSANVHASSDAVCIDGHAHHFFNGNVCWRCFANAGDEKDLPEIARLARESCTRGGLYCVVDHDADAGDCHDEDGKPAQCIRCSTTSVRAYHENGARCRRAPRSNEAPAPHLLLLRRARIFLAACQFHELTTSAKQFDLVAEQLANLLESVAGTKVHALDKAMPESEYKAALEEIAKNTSCSETKRRARRALQGPVPGPPPLPWVPGVTGKPAVVDEDGRPNYVKVAEEFVEEWAPGDTYLLVPLAEDFNDAYNAGWRGHERHVHRTDYPKATPEPPDAEDVLLRSDEIAKVELAGANISVGANVIVVSGEHVGRYGKVLSWRLRDDGRGYQVLLDQRLLPFHHRAEVKS